MSNSSFENYTPNFVLTSDLLHNAHVLDGASGSALKLQNNDYPEAFIKTLGPIALARSFAKNPNRIVDRDIDAVRTTYRDTYTELAKFGVEVVPFSVLEHNEELHIVARKVHGIALEAALKDRIPAAISGFEEVIGFQLNYCEHQRNKTIGQYLYDMTSLTQLMFGRYSDDTRGDRVLFVDIDPEDNAFSPANRFDADEYLHEVCLIAYDVVRSEELIGKDYRIAQARDLVNTELRRFSEGTDAEDLKSRAAEFIAEFETLTGEQLLATL